MVIIWRLLDCTINSIDCSMYEMAYYSSVLKSKYFLILKSYFKISVVIKVGVVPPCTTCLLILILVKGNPSNPSNRGVSSVTPPQSEKSKRDVVQPEFTLSK